MASPPPVPPRTYPRHALNLPAGSVRALLALGVLAVLWGIALSYGPETKLPLVFIYLQYLMVLILTHFFTAHNATYGPSVSQRSPLGLPRGSVRLVLVVGFVGLDAYLYHTHRDYDVPPKGAAFLLLGLLVTGYVLGHLLSKAMRYLGRGVLPAWYQDVEAWLRWSAFISGRDPDDDRVTG